MSPMSPSEWEAGVDVIKSVGHIIDLAPDGGWGEERIGAAGIFDKLCRCTHRFFWGVLLLA